MNLSKEARQALREYQRKWRAENRGRVKAINERYWERQAKKLLEEQPDKPEKEGDGSEN